MNTGAGAMNAGEMNDGGLETFELTFEADVFSVLEFELATWESSCNVSVTTKQNPDGSVTFKLEGGQEVLAKAQELYELKSSVEETTMDMDPVICQILTSATNIAEVREHLSKAGLEAMVSVSASRTQITITCLESKVANVRKVITGMFAKRQVRLTSHHETYLTSAEWSERERELQDSGKIDIQKVGSVFVIQGFAERVKEADDVIHELLKGNSYGIETLEIKDEHLFKLIEKYYRAELDQIVSKDFGDRIHINPQNEGGKYYIKCKGGSKDAKGAKGRVQQLVATIKKEEVPCHKPGMACYLTDPAAVGPALLKAFEDKNSCVIHVNSVTKPAAANVKVIKGDLTKQKVDVIVVPIATDNDELDGCGIVAKYIGKAGGASVSRDFTQHHTGLGMGRVGISDMTGSLKCSRIMYLGIRNWRGYSTRKMLAEGVDYILKKTEEFGYQSLAFPTIGCGQAKFPAREVGQVIVEAAKSSTSVQVSIVVYDDHLYHDFSSAVRTTGDRKRSSPGNARVSVGNITKTRADVLVSAVTTDNTDIYSECGQLARAVSEAAGRSFSREYANDGGLDDGEVRVQDPHNLHCKKVYHVSIRKWKGNTEKLLESCLNKCLSNAQRAGYNSVVFPTLGCGQLGYRPHVIARIMRDIIYQHPSLQVEIVAFKDDNIYEKFREAFDEEESMVALEAETLTLQVYAKDQRALSAAKTDLNKLIDKHYQEKAVKYSVTGDSGNFHRRLKNELSRIQNELAFLECDDSRQQIHIKGEKGAVAEAKSRVEGVMQAMKSEMKPQVGKPKGNPVPQCEYGKICAHFVKQLDLHESFFDHEYDRCYCTTCHKKRGESDYFTRGKPAKKYTTPVGWYKFALKLQSRAAALDVDSNWHRCYHGTKPESIKKILKVGQLVAAGHAVMGGTKVSVLPGHITEGAVKGFDVKQVFVSPSILYSDMYAHKHRFTDQNGQQRVGKVAFQVLIEPNSYKVDKETVRASGRIDPQISNDELEWSTNQLGSTELYAFLVKVE